MSIPCIDRVTGNNQKQVKLTVADRRKLKYALYARIRSLCVRYFPLHCLLTVVSYIFIRFFRRIQFCFVKSSYFLYHLYLNLLLSAVVRGSRLHWKIIYTTLIHTWNYIKYLHNTYIPIYIWRTRAYTHTFSCVHTYSYVCVRAGVRRCFCIYITSCAYTRVRVHIYTRIHVHVIHIWKYM